MSRVKPRQTTACGRSICKVSRCVAAETVVLEIFFGMLSLKSNRESRAHRPWQASSLLFPKTRRGQVKSLSERSNKCLVTLPTGLERNLQNVCLGR